MPLVLCWYLLHGISGTGNEDAVCDVLIQQLVAEPLPSLPAHDQTVGIEHVAKPEMPHIEHDEA